VAVAREEVVVIALEEVTLADVQRRRLPAESRPALVDDAFVPALRQAIARHESRDSGAEDRDAH
jgi:hypothetical protein